MMLIEAWERLRGYDKWTSTVATVLSTTLSRIDIGNDKSKSPLTVGWESVCRISWRDKSEIEHTSIFKAYEESPLYQLCEGDAVNIRYNPAKPSDYYLPELIQSRLTRTWKLTLYVLVIALLGIGFLVFLFAH
jgi:Protein of unknown function (DUF3592)